MVGSPILILVKELYCVMFLGERAAWECGLRGADAADGQGEGVHGRPTAPNA